MPIEDKVILYDRSRVVQDWKCPRSRYWGYEFNGRGVRKAATSLELFTGITVHDCLAAIATQQLEGGVDIDTIASVAFSAMKKQLLEASEGEVGADEFANEQATLTEGMLRGFYRHVWPRLLAEYPVIKFIEKEVEYKHPNTNLVFMSKPDLILENEQGDWVYIEYKTTSSKKTDWVNSWETAVQLHSSIKAVEQSLGQAPQAVKIVGMYKGYHSYGKQSSPFCYAYMRKGTPPFSEDLVAYEYRAGLKRYPTWELEGGVKKWVEDMPESVLADQFPLTPDIFINEDLVERFFIQRANRESEIAELMEQVNTDPQSNWEECIDRVFPQRFDQCVPYFGRACEFKKLCHGRCDDPLKEGYELRVPHHEAELERYTDV